MATKSKPISVVDYAIARLVKAGVKDIFGIPGDFAFPWGDAVTKNKDMKWLGVSNELNGSYAADGYARVNGLAALATTYAVGEMSALAGIMGAKAEKVPVIHLVGMPTIRMQKQPHKILHHTLGDGVYQNFINIGAQSACAHAILTPEKCRYEMERVISTCLAESEPGYIIVAQDYADMPFTGP